MRASPYGFRDAWQDVWHYSWVAEMSDRLFRLADGSSVPEPELVTMVAVAVYDRGPSVDRCERFEAQLAGYSVVRARGASSWQAVRRLVSEHRALLERRWSGAAGL